MFEVTCPHCHKTFNCNKNEEKQKKEPKTQAPPISNPLKTRLTELEKRYNELYAKNKLLEEQAKKHHPQDTLHPLDEDKIKREVERQTQKQIEDFKSKELHQTQEHYRLRILEKDQKIRTIEGKLEAAIRSASSSSNLMQGLALEIDLQKQIQQRFPNDLFEKIAAGYEGADLIQTVRYNHQMIAGKILWEFKNTKSYNHDWIIKLKKDQEKSKCPIAVLASQTLPNDVKGMDYIDGIYVVKPTTAPALASMLRNSLMQLARQQISQKGKAEKKEWIYQYLTGPEFRQKVELIVHSFEALQNQLDKEKIAYKRIWAAREKMLERVIDATSTMYGNIEGIATGSNILNPDKHIESSDKILDF